MIVSFLLVTVIFLKIILITLITCLLFWQYSVSYFSHVVKSMTLSQPYTWALQYSNQDILLYSKYLPKIKLKLGPHIHFCSIQQDR